jgi:hypothetical protein
MSSITATDSEAESFLLALEQICAQQKIISAQLDELILLMQMPSEDVLRILRELLIPLGQDSSQVSMALMSTFLPAAAPHPKQEA